MTADTQATDLAAAQRCAARADFTGCLTRCQTLATANANNSDALLSIGALLLSAGLLSAAEVCFERVCNLAPTDARPWVNRANRAREAGEHVRARQITQALLAQFPNHPVIRRNALISLEYDPEAPDTGENGDRPRFLLRAQHLPSPAITSTSAKN